MKCLLYVWHIFFRLFRKCELCARRKKKKNKKGSAQQAENREGERWICEISFLLKRHEQIIKYDFSALNSNFHVSWICKFFVKFIRLLPMLFPPLATHNIHLLNDIEIAFMLLHAIVHPKYLYSYILFLPSTHLLEIVHTCCSYLWTLYTIQCMECECISCTMYQLKVEAKYLEEATSNRHIIYNQTQNA